MDLAVSLGYLQGLDSFTFDSRVQNETQATNRRRIAWADMHIVALNGPDSVSISVGSRQHDTLALFLCLSCVMFFTDQPVQQCEP